MHPDPSTVRGIFLDRDGVMIENRSSHVQSIDDVEFIPQALSTLASINSLPFPIIIVTNQSVIGRGIISYETANEINAFIRSEVARSGGRIDAIYMCPHRPEDRCNCRKPRPGMLFRAADDYRINLAASILIGDALSDIEAARAAGINQTGLVLTGRGKSQVGFLGQYPDTIVRANLAAVIQDLFFTLEK